jgi:hypothetical protein
MRGCTGTPLRGPRRERQLWQPGRRPRVRLREPPRQESAVALSACPRARRPGCPRSLCAGGCQREPWPRTAAAPARRNRQPRVRYVGGLLRSWSPGSPAHPARSCAPCRCQPHRWLCRLTPVRPLGRSYSPRSLGAAGRRRAPATVGGRVGDAPSARAASLASSAALPVSAWPRLLADPWSAPPAAAITTWPGCHPGWSGTPRVTGCRTFGVALAVRARAQAVAAVEVPQLLERVLLDRAACFLRPNRTGPCCEQRETDAHRRR